MSAERLQKILSAAGIASRRAAEQIILEGRVTVNGHKVKELGVKADITKDHVKVDGKLVRIAVARRYILMNKPKGLIVTRDDPGGIPTIFELLRGRVGERVVAVGRLDVESEGLLILTDDGPLVHKLTHPSGGCRKEYEVKVSGVPTPETLTSYSLRQPPEGCVSLCTSGPSSVRMRSPSDSTSSRPTATTRSPTRPLSNSKMVGMPPGSSRVTMRPFGLFMRM